MKKVNIYDKNHGSIFLAQEERFRQSGLEIVWVNYLEEVLPGELLIINPLSPVIAKKHWKEIQDFVSKDQNKIILFVPYMTKEMVEAATGSYAYVGIVTIEYIHPITKLLDIIKNQSE